jgi:Bacterial aa3 type cytochrome c oxidase subunit IV
MDYEQHVETYHAFLRFTKYAVIFLAVLLLGMKIFLV